MLGAAALLLQPLFRHAGAESHLGACPIPQRLFYARSRGRNQRHAETHGQRTWEMQNRWRPQFRQCSCGWNRAYGGLGEAASSARSHRVRARSDPGTMPASGSHLSEGCPQFPAVCRICCDAGASGTQARKGTDLRGMPFRSHESRPVDLLSSAGSAPTRWLVTRIYYLPSGQRVFQGVDQGASKTRVRPTPTGLLRANRNKTRSSEGGLVPQTPW